MGNLGLVDVVLFLAPVVVALSLVWITRHRG
jgi:hypothetical protein